MYCSQTCGARVQYASSAVPEVFGSFRPHLQEAGVGRVILRQKSRYELGCTPDSTQGIVVNRLPIITELLTVGLPELVV